MDLANKVAKRREELGWTQDELAKRMGYSSRTSINKIENGRPCSQKIIYRLAEALDVPISYLMDWNEDEETKEKPSENEGLSESRRILIEFAKTIPDDKADLAIRLLKSIVESD